MTNKWIKNSLTVLSLFQMALPVHAQTSGTATTPAPLNRPIQYVFMAFDGSYNNSVWTDSRNLAKKLNSMDPNDTDKLHLTYFINPVYLLWKCPASDTKCVAPPYKRSDWYNPPGYRDEAGPNGTVVKVKNVGSAIGWGDNAKDISTRLDNMNDAFLEGNEIGSHAVGHFDGSSWTYADWKSEFTQFYNILDNVFTVNKLPPSPTHGNDLLFRNSIIGFRAPLLGKSDGLYQALPEFGIKYDTSKENFPTRWPIQDADGLWSFPLADIQRPGTGKTVPTMDYNFCYVDTKRYLQTRPELLKYTEPGKPANSNSECLNTVPADVKAEIKQNMMSMYMNYFNNNYYGNRAPVSIGHHFSSWMSGAYYETFKEFAQNVCTLPEVRCVTFGKYMDFINSIPASDIAQYQAGNFPKLPRPKSSMPDRPLDLKATLAQVGNNLQIQTSGRDANMHGLTPVIYVGTNKFAGNSIPLQKVRDLYSAGANVSIRAVLYNQKGDEAQSATHQISNVGTPNEVFNPESAEEKILKGHLNEAHEHEADFVNTNSPNE